MEQKKNAAESIVRWTDKLDKKPLVLVIVHEHDWCIFADEFSSSRSRSTDAKATRNVQPAILQALYAELLDAVVKGNKEVRMKIATMSSKRRIPRQDKRTNKSQCSEIYLN